MTPQQIPVYWNFLEPKTFLAPFAQGAPNTSDLPLVERSVIQLPRNTLFTLAIQAVTSKFAALDDDGQATSHKKSLADFTGTPVLMVQTVSQWKTGSDEFVLAFNGYQSVSWHSLADGRAALGGVISTSTAAVEFDDDYVLQAWLKDAGGNILRIPNRPIYCDIRADVGAEVTEGTGVPAIRYEGPFTIPEGADYLDIAITNLTASTGRVASLQQHDNGNGLTTLWPTITTGNLRINAGATAPAGGWQGYYILGSL